jgi:hypothetical protein
MTRIRATSNGDIPFTAAEEAEADAAEAKAIVDKAAQDAIEAVSTSKLTGIEILGVMCSATRWDQERLSAITTGAMISKQLSQPFPDTLFEFKNGNSLIITESNFEAIYVIWFPFRQSFFKAD